VSFLGRTALACNPVSITLALCGTAGLIWLPFLRSAPNRMVSGEPVTALMALQQAPLMLNVASCGIAALLFIVCCWPIRRSTLWLQAGLSCALMAILLALAAQYAQYISHTESTIARTSLGGAFWLLMVLCWLAAADALQRLHSRWFTRVLVALAAVLPLVVMLSAGWCDDLSIMKEYANRTDIFVPSILRHMQIVLLALLPTVLVGVPLGWWAFSQPNTNGGVFALLNVIQTIPSIALFGLMMVPLALLAARYPVLAQAGISGVGMAPGVIALVLYSLLPVTRGTLAGLAQVPHAVVQAARGMGMSPLQIAWKVQLPLALPILLSGLHSATIAAVGMATITALIGAGGLGAIMFEGLFSSAQDLVLLGVVPIVALAVITDATFKMLIQFTLRITHAAHGTTLSQAPQAPLAALGAGA
jgi:osmoprotectant transport system permease protein